MARPTRRDRTKPAELIGLAAGIGVFTLLIVFMGTREWNVAAEFAGVAFIVGLVGLAMLSLTSRPNDAERDDLDEQKRAENPAPSDQEPEDRGPRGH